ncbi:N-acetylglucosamine-6-phosphate deacetylase [Alkalibacterium putridalgicola]|uniref:N-acetylglucosamine-6-phosphate deacetylase n=1 Tax=Alkalibacterium putridalgicola TaxID=426703 RepID=A0A1H7U6X9_9LACT|nr:N-acetylglucosamine-6-phosphate deacetylase [Alkalibacterium putridalgicola]GEK89619.1 N-acetylglucosamine-6-phosphate deacetylase [Alkalibacterium putridalgicola]SEL92792.1 N-acetylglucosamine-6-phosphate deacetylase [Alkalibacterium putridalgicola]
MIKVYINAHIFTGEGEIENGFIRFSNEILDVGKMEHYEKKIDEEESDLKGNYIIPGFIDVHSHGGYGIDNMDADPKKISDMTYKMLEEGITSYFPTTMTQSDENIEASLKAINEAAQMNPMIQGIHVEGPFISKDFKGAQPEEFIRPAQLDTLEKWQKLSGERIRLITYAPETGDVKDFETYCQENDIILSAGHSGATYEQLKESGATHITHLFNGQLGLHHREIGVSGFGLLEDNVKVEMIVDGHHISKEMVKLAYKAKGAEGIELITDSMRAKGSPEGESELGGQKVIVKDKQARLSNGSLAGSVLTFIDAFNNMMAFTDCSMLEAVKMSSYNQAKEFNLTTKGELNPNFDADMVILDKDHKLQETILGGNIHAFN